MATSTTILVFLMKKRRSPKASKRQNRKNIPMQVIKFRGRSIADGSIVYGGVLQYATASYIVQPDTRHADASPRCIEVHPDSVGQYINVKTVDGEEIYTGDEVYYFDPNNEDTTRRGIVRYDEETAAFYVAGVLQIPVYFESHFEYYKLNSKQ